MTGRDVAFLRLGVAGRCSQNACKHHSPSHFAHNHLLGRSLIGVHRTLPLPILTRKNHQVLGQEFTAFFSPPGRNAANHWSAYCGTPAWADSCTTTQGSPHRSTPARARSSTTTQGSTHGGSAGRSPGYPSTHRPARCAAATRSTDRANTATASIDAAATPAETSTTAPTAIAAKRRCDQC